MVTCSHQGTCKCHCYDSFISCLSTWNMLFPFTSHCDIIGSKKLWRRLINIYDELIWNVKLKDYIGNFVKKLWSQFSPKRRGNYWPWCSDCATWKFHPLLQWLNQWSFHFKIYILPNLSSFLRIKPFSTPAVHRFRSIECNLRSSASSVSNGRPLTLPIVD